MLASGLKYIIESLSVFRASKSFKVSLPRDLTLSTLINLRTEKNLSSFPVSVINVRSDQVNHDFMQAVRCRIFLMFGFIKTFGLGKVMQTLTLIVVFNFST